MMSFIILSVMWYEGLTRCYLLHTDPLEFRKLVKTCQATCFHYQLWIAGALLNIFFGSPNHDSQNSPNESHEVGSCTENEIMCHEIEPWALMRKYCHGFWTMGFCIVLCKHGLFWVLKEIFLKSMIILMWCGLPIK